MPPVPQYRELLLRMQERKAACKEFCGNCYTESEYIYVNELGIPYKPNFVSDHFKRVLKQHGLRPIRFHDSRYTCASLLLKNGVAVKDIQDWLGHSSYATTANIYAHLDTDSKKQPATKMNQTVSITPGISAAIQAGGENSRREPGFKKKILRFSIHEKPEYFQLVPVVGLEPTRYRYQRILSPSRLPIPSHWRWILVYYTRRPPEIQALFRAARPLPRDSGRSFYEVCSSRIIFRRLFRSDR